jgi:hypothetical protein
MGISITDEDFKLITSTYLYQESGDVKKRAINYKEFMNMMAQCHTMPIDKHK